MPWSQRKQKRTRGNVGGQVVVDVDFRSHGLTPSDSPAAMAVGPIPRTYRSAGGGGRENGRLGRSWW